MQAAKTKILEYIQEKGPVLPIQISKQFNGNTIFAGAYLSELVQNQKIKITNAKIGSSPIYYLPGQEEKISMLREHLSERPKMVFDLIKEHKILRDKDCEPWQRVALRELKDFAIPLNVNLNGNSEIFWKWYLLNNEEAKKYILNILDHKPKEAVKELPKEEIKEKNEEKIKTQNEEKILKNEENKESIKNDFSELEKQKKLTVQKSQDINSNIEKLEEQGEFYDIILDFFIKNKIKIKSQEVKKKKKELHFVAEIPSSIGSLKYLVVARNKKKLNDGDLSLAYHEGMDMKLPVLVLGKGSLTKKAEKYIEEKIKGLVFQKIE